MANTTDDSEKNNQDEDNFGLPDIEYKPLDELNKTSSTSEEPGKTAETNEPISSREDQDNTPAYDEEEEESSKAPMVISLIIGLVILVGGFMLYQYWYKPKQEKARQEQLAKEKKEADDKAEAERVAKAAEEERLRKEAENAKPVVGAIETLGQRTGHYFVIISSSVDGDLAMDRAKKLSAKGVGSKIIPPFGKWKFYRLGIGDFDSFASAQSSADASKAEYGDALWVMKY